MLPDFGWDQVSEQTIDDSRIVDQDHVTSFDGLGWLDEEPNAHSFAVQRLVLDTSCCCWRWLVQYSFLDNLPSSVSCGDHADAMAEAKSSICEDADLTPDVTCRS